MLGPKKLRIGLLNAGSLGTGHDEFLVAMARHDVDLMGINETWLRVGEEDRAPRVPGYRLRHKPRSSITRARGGGVGFYIKNSIPVRTLTHPLINAVDQMWLMVNMGGKKILLGTAYRPPWLNARTFLDALTEAFGSFSGYDHVILLGDFNINFLNPNCTISKMLIDFLTYTNLTQKITEPTHFTNHSESLIDLVCSDIDISDLCVDYISDLSSHAFISFEINIPKVKTKPVLKIYRQFYDIDLDNLKYLLENSNGINVENQQNIHEMVTTFTSNILWVFDYIAPIKYGYFKDFNYPWITYNIRLMMKTRDEAHIKARKTKLSSHMAYYKELKSIVNTAIETEKSAYFSSYINNFEYNSTKLWKHLKHNIPCKNNKSNSALPENLQDPDKICQHFFTSIPGSGEVSSSTLNYFQTSRYNNNTFKLVTVDTNTILRVLRSLKSKAVGTDGISLQMLKISLPNIIDTITSMVNTSILCNSFPSIWKQSIIRPIPKKDNPTEYKDLRPISILPCLSKILEKIVSHQFSEYIERNEIFPSVQSGFRKHRSTTTALTNVVDDILCAQDHGMSTILVLLDFSRAFDVINLSLLLAKLKYYGCSSETVEWFNSYLLGRTQCVEVTRSDGSSFASKCYSMDRGVPQGSILGPLLFNLYCATVTQEIINCHYHIYADDIQIYISFKPNKIQEAINLLNEDLNRISFWSRSHGLVLNPNKTKYLILGTQIQLKSFATLRLNIKIQNDIIERVTEARNLGVIMDENLRFEKHILNVIKNCFYRLKLLYRIRKYLKTSVRIKLCDALILSKLNYADTVIGPRLLSRTKNLIQRVQNSCARFCFSIPPRAHVTPFLNTAKILKMDYRRQLHFATLLFGVVKYRVPLYLYHKLKWASEQNTIYNTRASSYLLIIPSHRTAAFQGSFKYSATKCWNNLPPPFRNLKSIKTFKNKYKEYLLKLQQES